MGNLPEIGVRLGFLDDDAIDCPLAEAVTSTHGYDGYLARDEAEIHHIFGDTPELSGTRHCVRQFERR